MKAYFVRRGGSYDDMVIRAPDEREARNFVSDLDGAELVEIDPTVATVMLVPDARGRHDGAITNWIKGPPTLLGDPTIEGFLLEGKTDQEVLVKHRASDHVYQFMISDDGSKLLNEHTIVPSLSSPHVDAGALSSSARRAAYEFLRRPRSG
jgi:hypothetical protein